MLFGATRARDSQEKGLATRGYSYYLASYMVVTDSYTAGDNQLYDSAITP